MHLPLHLHFAFVFAILKSKIIRLKRHSRDKCRI